MNKLALFCKSFHEDVHRIRRLAQSIEMYNHDRIPFYVSVPAGELEMFKASIGEFSCHLLTDEEILARSIEANGPPPEHYPRLVMQQIVKMEFWRLGLCENYFWVDSDSYFIRPFQTSDFFSDEGHPYTVMYEEGELFDFARKHNKEKVISDYARTAAEFKEMFDRQGPDYLFGPSPLLWSTEVMQGLHQDFLSRQGVSVYEFFRNHPCEINLYAEYLLSSLKVPFVPRAPFFKVFHYPEQFFESQYLGEWDRSLAENYMGIVIQSNWAKPDLKKKKKTLIDRVKVLLGSS
jgi:hypothetical protein